VAVLSYDTKSDQHDTRKKNIELYGGRVAGIYATRDAAKTSTGKGIDTDKKRKRDDSGNDSDRSSTRNSSDNAPKG
jgi:hypothetical protein